MPDESPLRVKLLAGAGLVTISTAVGLLYKTSQAASGGFKYSTLSACTIAEAIKFCLSLTFFTLDKSHHTEGVSKLSSAYEAARQQLSLSAVAHIWFLSAVYAANNQLSFFVYMLADPGTIFLFKSGSTLIVATVQTLFVGAKFAGEQWRAMFMQACGMIVVQWDPCTQSGIYRPLAYCCMAVSTSFTALATVRNEYLVKNYKIALNVQNAVLYAGGFWMNLAAFFFLPNPNSSQASLGFFDGYSNPLALGVVTCNALIGLAITAVYKYADAVVKCIAGDVTAVLLCILSSFFFGMKATLTTWCGVIVVVFSVHLYIEAGQRLSAAASAANDKPAAPANSSQPAESASGEEKSKEEPPPSSDQSSNGGGPMLFLDFPLGRPLAAVVAVAALATAFLSVLYNTDTAASASVLDISAQLPTSSAAMRCMEPLLRVDDEGEQCDSNLGGEKLEAAVLACLRANGKGIQGG